MTPAEYLDPVRFPLTSQSGLSLAQQRRIDAFNYDQLQHYQAEGNLLDSEQKQIFAELSLKIAAQSCLDS